jgi:predicted Ser/Thr protein kinase
MAALLDRVEAHLKVVRMHKAPTPRVPEALAGLVSVLVDMVEDRRAAAAIGALRGKAHGLRVHRVPAAGSSVDNVVSACLPKAASPLQIGDGHFGKVYRIPRPTQTPAGGHKGHHKGKYLAVKVQELGGQWSGDKVSQQQDSLRDLEREVKWATIAGDLGVGPRVVDALVCVQRGALYGLIVMEHVQGVTLAAWRKNASPSELEKAEQLVLAKVARLHDAGVAHSDLHAGNIMVSRSTANKQLDVWILDYGFAKSLSEYQHGDVADMRELVDGRKPVVTQGDVVAGVTRGLLRDGTFAGLEHGRWSKLRVPKTPATPDGR